MDNKEGIKKLLDIALANGDIVHLPIVSMRSYDTGLYDLTCDGNFNRIISVWFNVIEEYKKSESKYFLNITVVLPSSKQMTPESQKLIDKIKSDVNYKKHLRFYQTENFPSGGPKQERSLKDSVKLSQEIIDKLFFKVAIYEMEYVGVCLEMTKAKSYLYENFKTVFWCPVSDTDEVKPSFLENVRYVDLELAKSCDYLMVATESQKNYFKNKCLEGDDSKIIFNPMLIDPSLQLFSFKKDMVTSQLISSYVSDGYNVVYFPFRMSDPGYKFEMVMHLLVSMSSEYPICVLYSDPNDSHKMEDYLKKYSDSIENSIDKKYIATQKISSSRNVYYTCISDKRCIIPYFEDVDNIMHASWQEMEYYGSTVVHPAFPDSAENVYYRGLVLAMYNSCKSYLPLSKEELKSCKEYSPITDYLPFYKEEMS